MQPITAGQCTQCVDGQCPLDPEKVLNDMRSVSPEAVDWGKQVLIIGGANGPSVKNTHELREPKTPIRNRSFQHLLSTATGNGKLVVSRHSLTKECEVPPNSGMMHVFPLSEQKQEQES